MNRMEQNQENPKILKIMIQTGNKKPPLSFQNGGLCFI